MAFCGNGAIEPGESCDLGNGNVDRPALQVAQGGFVFAVAPYELPQSGASFYNYSSASAHTGFEQLNGSAMLFYRNTTNSILSLIQVHGIDFDTTGLSQPPSQVIMDFGGLPFQTQVAVVDDQGEINSFGPTVIHADWSFQDNSDGLLIAGFPLPGNWSVTVSPKFVQGINTWSWITDKGVAVALALDTPVTLTAFNAPSKCRSDCSIPICGDGILDGGEICDDGNNTGGDGCSADCKALQ